MKFKLFIKKAGWDAALFIYDDEGKALACNYGRWADDIGTPLYYLRHTDKTLDEIRARTYLYDLDWVQDVEQEYDESTAELVLTEEGEYPNSNPTFLDLILWEEEKEYVRDKLNGFSVTVPAHTVCYFTYGDTEGLEDREVEWLEEQYSDYNIKRIASHLDPFIDRYDYNGTQCEFYEALVTPRHYDKEDVQDYLDCLKKSFTFVRNQLDEAVLFACTESWDKLSEVISNISSPLTGNDVTKTISRIQKAISYLTTNKTN